MAGKRKGLVGRGVVSDTPHWEGQNPNIAEPPRSGGGGGGGSSRGGGSKTTPVQRYIGKAMLGGKAGWVEERNLIGQAVKGQEAGGYGMFPYGEGRQYAPVLRDGESLEVAVAEIAKNAKMTPAQVIEAAGGAEELERMARTNQGLAQMGYMARRHGAENAARQIGTDLVGEDAKRQALALQALGLEQQALRQHFAGADAAMPPWLPRMNNLSPVQTGMAYAALAAGTGAAGVALANQLMAQGQQQSSPVEYAAAMQALNAYA